VMYYKDPYVEVGYRGLNGSFTAQRKLALDVSYDMAWCKAYGWLYSFYEDQGEGLTGRKLLTPSYDEKDYVIQSLQATSSHDSEYVNGLYCANQGLSMLRISIDKAKALGRLSKNWPNDPPPPIHLDRQK
jgi:hypothetical protein